MKSLVVYSSKSGNTRKLAEAAYAALPDGQKEIFSIAEAPSAEGYDLVVAAFWLMAGKPDPASTDFLAGVGHTRLFLAATHGAAAASDHAKAALQKAKDLAASAEIVGTFNCQGEVSPGFLEKASKKEPPPPWLGDAATAVGHPNGEDLAALTNVLLASVAPE